jgi:hypothetical protein
MDLVMLKVGNGMSWFSRSSALVRRACSPPDLTASARKNSRNAAAPRQSRGLFVISSDWTM